MELKNPLLNSLAQGLPLTTEMQSPAAFQVCPLWK